VPRETITITTQMKAPLQEIRLQNDDLMTAKRLELAQKEIEHLKRLLNSKENSLAIEKTDLGTTPRFDDNVTVTPRVSNSFHSPKISNAAEAFVFDWDNFVGMNQDEDDTDEFSLLSNTLPLKSPRRFKGVPRSN